MNLSPQFVIFALVLLGCTTNRDSVAIEDAMRPKLDAAPPPHDQFSTPPELCNGRDDDEDGRIDEDFELNSPCEAEIGRCIIRGEIECAPDDGTQCSAVAHQTTTERCNETDDDCDGIVDEGFEVSVPCTNAPGVCGSVGRSQCTLDEQSVLCDAQTLPPQDEQCNALDDDCDNRVDEGFGLGDGCEVGQGACRRIGMTTCDSNGLSICDAVIVSPQNETCNRVDDDCDGEIDEAVCTQQVRSSCRPSLIWRTDLDAIPFPLSMTQCDQLGDTDADYACAIAASSDAFATIELPFRNDAIVLGYGFGLGVTCDDELPDWLEALLVRDCRIYFGFSSPAIPPTRQTDTLAGCPRELFGYTESFDAGCASVPFGEGFTGIEFNRALQFGDQIAFAFECRQSTNDPENAIIRNRLNQELILEMGWAKANAEFITEPMTDWLGCTPPAPSSDENVRCARSGAGTTFGLLSIVHPASLNAPTPDIIGLRLYQEEDAP